MQTPAWRRASVLVAVLVVGLSIVGPAAAQTPPVNDEPAGAIDLGSSSPQTVTGDITDATRSATDPACGGSGKTLWYTFTAPGDGTLSLAPLSVDFQIAAALLEGPPDQLRLDGCVDLFPVFGFPVFSGQRYYPDGERRWRRGRERSTDLYAVADHARGGSRGAPERRRFGHRDGHGDLRRTGRLPRHHRRRGTTAAVKPSDRHRADRIECPLDHPWSMTIDPDGRAFHPGRMSLTLTAIRCGLTHCDARRTREQASSSGTDGRADAPSTIRRPGNRGRRANDGRRASRLNARRQPRRWRDAARIRCEAWQTSTVKRDVHTAAWRRASAPSPSCSRPFGRRPGRGADIACERRTRGSDRPPVRRARRPSPVTSPTRHGPRATRPVPVIARRFEYIFTPGQDGTLATSPISVDSWFFVAVLTGPLDQLAERGCIESPGYGFPALGGQQYYLMVAGSGVGDVSIRLSVSPSRIALVADRDAHLNTRWLGHRHRHRELRRT